MTAPNSYQNFKAPQPPTPPAIHSPALTRVVGVLRGFTGMASAVSLTVLVAEAVLPSGLKPSTLIGGFNGRIEAADAAAKTDALTALTRKNAEAASQPPAFSGMEADAFRQQQQVLADSLQSGVFIANTADAACAAGKVIPSDNRDWGWVGALAQLACGIGDETRAEMMSKLKRGGQDNSVLIQRPRADGVR